jgi:hypothetical protein
MFGGKPARRGNIPFKRQQSLHVVLCEAVSGITLFPFFLVSRLNLRTPAAVFYGQNKSLSSGRDNRDIIHVEFCSFPPPFRRGGSSFLKPQLPEIAPKLKGLSTSTGTCGRF